MRKKRTRPISGHLDRTRLVNKDMNNSFIADNPERVRENSILLARVRGQGLASHDHTGSLPKYFNSSLAAWSQFISNMFPFVRKAVCK